MYGTDAITRPTTMAVPRRPLATARGIGVATLLGASSWLFVAAALAWVLR